MDRVIPPIGVIQTHAVCAIGTMEEYLCDVLKDLI
jgi:hypothetical protein